jgi:hypothetical protein
MPKMFWKIWDHYIQIFSTFRVRMLSIIGPHVVENSSVKADLITFLETYHGCKDLVDTPL